MERNQGRNSNIVYGICTNTGGKKDGTPCSKCQNKEKQAIRASKDFVCEECGEPLTKVDPPKVKPPKWLYAILALVIVGGGLGAYFGFFRNAEKSEPKPEPLPYYIVSLSVEKESITLDVGNSETLKATVSTTPGGPYADVHVSFTSDNADVAQVDTAGVVRAIAKGETTITVVARSSSGYADTAKVRVIVNDDVNLGIIPPEKSLKEESQNPLCKKQTSGWGKISIDWYVYEGPCKNGKPADGVNGEMRITKHYLIDLKDGKGSTLEVNRGDIIVNPKFKDGKFMLQGELHRPDGTRRVL